MEQNKLPKNIRQIGEKEDWIRVYMEDYVYTYIQRLRGLQENGISGGILLGRKQRVNGIMHLFIRGAVVAEDPFWRDSGQTPGKLRAEASVYFPGLEICGFFISSQQSQSSEMEMIRIFEKYFSSEYQILFQVRNQEEEVFSYSGHGLVRLAGYYVYYEKNEEMQSYIVRQESLRALGHQSGGGFSGNSMGSAVKSAIAGKSEKADKLKNSAKRGFGRRTENKAEQSPAIGLKSTNKAVSADNKTGTKKKLQKGDLLVRAASVAGIFILAFLLFSDQIKFNKISSDVTESGSEILSSLLNETDAVQAGADSVYIVSGDEESTAGIGEENSGAENGMGGSGLENGTENNNGETGAESNGVEVGNSSAEVGNSSAEVGNSSAEVGNSSAEIGNSSAEVGSSSAEVGGNSAEAGTGESSAEVASGSDTGSMAENVDSSYVFPLRYLVKKGDSLYAISEKYYGDTTMVDAICQANDITDPSQLRYGTVLILPSR